MHAEIAMLIETVKKRNGLRDAGICERLKMSVSQLQHMRSAKELDRLDFWRVEKLAELAGKKVTWEEECERKMESGKN